MNWSNFLTILAGFILCDLFIMPWIKFFVALFRNKMNNKRILRLLEQHRKEHADKWKEAGIKSITVYDSNEKVLMEIDFNKADDNDSVHS